MKVRDFYRFLLVRTSKDSISVIAASDVEEAIEDEYLMYCRIHDEEIKEGKIRFDIYRWG